MKNIKFLENKWWFRLLKVFYIFLFILISIKIVAQIYDHHSLYELSCNCFITNYDKILSYSLLGLAVNLFVFKSIEHIFYYVVLGKFNLKKDNNIKEIQNEEEKRN